MRTGHTKSPWLAREPDSLRCKGYVVQNPGDSATFYAPGEYSDLDTTCGVLVLWTRRR